MISVHIECLECLWIALVVIDLSLIVLDYIVLHNNDLYFILLLIVIS